jgi:hypothetical protein
MTYVPQEPAKSLPVSSPIALQSYESYDYGSNPKGKKYMKSIYDACMNEISVYCGEKAIYALKLYITGSQEVKKDALCVTHECMCKHINLYSSNCRDAIFKVMEVPQVHVDPQYYGTMPGWNPAPSDRREPHPKLPVDSYPNAYPYGQDVRMIYPPRYGGGNEIDVYRFDSEDQRHPDQGHDRGHHHHHHHHHHGIHPIAWIFILPFFSIGLFVSVKFIASNFRRYRELSRQSTNGIGEYMPLRGP